MDVRLRKVGHWLTSRARRWLPRGAGPRWPRLTPATDAIERVVHLLDTALPVPGTRFRVGLDPLLGLFFPAVGDAVGGFVSLGVIALAVQYRVPGRVIGKMVFNVAVDSVAGSIPIVGDVFDFGWKANDRNFALMMSHRGDLPKRATLGYWLSVGGLFLIGLACVLAPIALLVWLLLRWDG